MDKAKLCGFFINVGVGVIIALVTAFATTTLGFWRFRDEKWWSRKADAYSVIIDSLHVSKDCSTQDLAEMRAIDAGIQINEEYRKELMSRAREADRQIRKAIDTSSFLLCDEAVRVLEELRAGLDRADALLEDQLPNDLGGYQSFLKSQMEAIKTCLDHLPKIAKQDLRKGWGK
jgi:hypothetical protein